MEKLLSFRIPDHIAKDFYAGAKRLGLSKSEYARRALDEFNHRVMRQRIAGLSRRLAPQSIAEAQTMDSAIGDGLNG